MNAATRAAADLAALLPREHPLARVGRLTLDAHLREETTVNATRIGAPLRDAAVDPRPGDLLPPTNAGHADPHGPDVVAIEVDDPRRVAAVSAHRSQGGAA